MAGTKATVQAPPTSPTTSSRTPSSTTARASASQRYFTIPGRDPFDEIEWELRDALIPGQGRARLRAEGRRVPEVLVADGDEHRRAEVLPRPHGLARARALRQADDRPRRRHDRRLGPRGRLLRDRRRGRDVRGRAEGDPRQPARLLQLAGLVQRRLRGEAAVLGVLHPLDRRLDGVDPRLDPPRGHHLPRRLGLRRQPLAAALVEGAALEGRLRLRPGLVHARRRRVRRHDQVRRQDAARGEDGRARRRPPRRRGVHLVQGEARRRRRACSRRRATTCRSTRPTGRSIQYQNANNSVRVTDAFMEAARGGKEWNLTARTDGTVVDTIDARDLLRADRRGGLAVRRPGRAVRHDDQRVAHVPEHRAGSTRRTRARSTCTSTTRRATSPRST